MSGGIIEKIRYCEILGEYYIMIGVIILNYNTAKDTIECINSIISTTKETVHIYVVDGGSTDNSVSVLKQYRSDRYTLIECHDNLGFARGNNIGIKRAIDEGCEFILISNPDIVYSQNSIDHMLQTLKTDPTIGIVGPACKSLDQEESQLLRKTYNDFLYLCSKKPFVHLQNVLPFLRTEFPYPKERKGVYKFCGMVRGCCFMLSSKLFGKMNYFDEHTFLYCEEWILANKLQSYQLYCACDFDSRVLHKEATSTNQKGSAFKAFHLYLSSFYYMKLYNKSSRILLAIYYLQNYVVFNSRARRNENYRALLKNFNSQLKKIYLAKDSKDCPIITM